MEAKVKATGEIVEIVGEGIQNANIVMSTHGEWFSKDELDIIPLNWKPFEPTYWQKLEHQYAGMAMQGMLASQYDIPNFGSGDHYKNAAILASKYAHALVEKYKEKEER